jgi:hypothetical protein
MKRYSILHPLFMSFYSKSLYQDVGRRWEGLGFLYLFLLLALCWIAEMVQLHSGFTAWLDKEAPMVVRQIPSITISNGEVSTDVQTPHVIVDARGEKIAIIDLTGATTSLEDSGAAILLTRKTLAVRNAKRGETRAYDLSGVRNFSLDRGTVEGWVALARNWLAWFLYPIAVLFSYLYRILQALLYGAIGILFAKMVNTELDYQALVRLAVVAITPVIVLDTVRSVADAQIPAWWLICFVIAMGYLFYGVKACSENKAEGLVYGSSASSGRA